MVYKSFLNGVLSAVLLCSAAVAHADMDFDQGVNAFKQQDYQQAVKSFLQSRQQGNQSSILAYNLAVSYYKLGKYDQAKLYFQEILSDPELTALGYYNLGLIAQKRNEPQAAKTAFSKSFNAAKDDKVRMLAARQLDEPVVAKKESLFDKATGFISLGVAHDDNVTRANEDIPTVANSSDSYLDFYAAGSYQHSGEWDDGLQFKGSMVVTRYSDLSAYDENRFSIGAYLSKPLAEWRTRSGLVYTHSTVDGSAYLQQFTLKLRADNRYAPDQRLRLKYDLSRYDELDVSYSYLSGIKQRFTIENRSRLGEDKLRLGYALELNSRDDFSALNTFSSYSPTRHNLFAVYDRVVSDKWSAQGRFDYRDSNYGDANVSGGINLGVRDESRSRYTLSAAYEYRRDTEFEMKWRHTSNDSNYISENYSSNLIMLSANHYFD